MRNICNVLGRVQSIVAHEGFAVHPEKTRVLRKSRQQEVTGVVVNQKLNISSKTLKRFRATVYQVDKDGPDGKRWGNSSDVIASLQGFANYVYMVNPEKGAQLQGQVRGLMAKYGWRPAPVVRRVSRSRVRAAEPVAEGPIDPIPPGEPAGARKPAKKKWWKFW
ncbi:MAG TPA: hypothetical protein VJX67_04650 [Blastocatellia bacterium]|nr:hypothetical protein [Blastocatellia bacterium]